MVLLRSLLEDTDLMTYFAYYPLDAKEWIEQLSREPVWSDKVFRAGIHKFRTSQIWERLRGMDVEPVGQRDFPMLSAAVHASPWGIRYYGGKLSGDSDQIHLALVPNYDLVGTLMIGLALQGTYPMPIHAFLESCAASRVPRSLWRTIKARYVTILEGWQAKVDSDSWVIREMVNAETRLAQGDDPQSVLEDLRQRIEEEYGEAADATSSNTFSNDVDS